MSQNDKKGKARVFSDDTSGELTNRVVIVGNFVYEGNAHPGADENKAVWQVSRFDKANLITLWADGNAKFDNKWADYLTLNYL